jgi:hypothetical protein
MAQARSVCTIASLNPTGSYPFGLKRLLAKSSCYNQL